MKFGLHLLHVMPLIINMFGKIGSVKTIIY